MKAVPVFFHSGYQVSCWCL